MELGQGDHFRIEDRFAKNGSFSSSASSFDGDAIGKARERECLLWLINKAHGSVRDDLKEPYYQDGQGKKCIKPDYVLGLTSGELYAEALGNTYRNPTFCNYTHDEILQFLMKKGIRLTYDDGNFITETDLSFNRPIRLTAHLPLIEAMMLLSQKEAIYSPNGVHKDPPVKSVSAKKTAFAPLPNVTTWVDKRVSGIDDDDLPENNFQPSQSHALNMKLALEEKRRKLQSEHSKKGHEWIQQTAKAGEAAFMQFAAQPSSALAEDSPDDHLYEEINENRATDETMKESHRRAKWNEQQEGEDIDPSSMNAYSTRQPPKPLPRRNLSNSDTMVKKPSRNGLTVNGSDGVDNVRSHVENESTKDPTLDQFFPVGESTQKPGGAKFKPKVIRNPPQSSSNGRATGNSSNFKSLTSDRIRSPVIQRDFANTIDVLNPDQDIQWEQEGSKTAASFDLVEQNGDDDMERKKQKLMMSQIKRRSELEAARRAKEQENVERAELIRQQQEEATRKREEDRIRRQLIFDQYQKRKTEAKAADDLPSPQTVMMRDGPKSRGRGRPVSMHANSISQALTSPVTEYNKIKRSPSQSDIMKIGQELSILSLHNPRLAAASARHSNTTERRALSPPPVRYRAPTVDSNLSDAGSSNSGQEIYSGPKLFKKPTAKSNRQIIHNAIRDSCLKGEVDKPLRTRALDALGRTDGCHFLVLFREGQFKGLYSYDPESSEAIKFFGIGPNRVDDSMTEKLYQYNSGAKTFKVVTTTHHMSVQIDGFTLQSALWTGKKTVGPKAPLEMF